MANNQDFVCNLFRDIAAEGFASKFEDALDDDLAWVATGSSALSGEYKGKQVYLEKIIGQLHARLQSWPKAIVENIFVDGDVACVQFHGEGGIGKNGANFDMQYCWVMKIRNQKIVHVTGYYDSVKMAALFQRLRFQILITGGRYAELTLTKEVLVVESPHPDDAVVPVKILGGTALGGLRGLAQASGCKT